MPNANRGESPMSETETRERLDRYPAGRILAPQRYIDYDGQVIIRTRYGTLQRWITEGWDTGRRGLLPYILGKRECREQPDKAPMNDHLEAEEFDVYYVADSETVGYRVADTAEIER